MSPDRAHAWGMAALAVLERSAWLRQAATMPPDPRLEVRVLGHTFPSPVGIAGGFDKNGRCPRALAALGFGFVEVGTVTALAQAPNPSPNLFRLPLDRALINRLGFPNDGAEAVAARLRHTLAGKALGVPLAVSIGKSRAVPIEPFEGVLADYEASFNAVAEIADVVIVNVSSPNTQGLRALQSTELAKRLFERLSQRGSAMGRPVLVKIAPDLSPSELDDVLGVIKESGLSGLVATNTTTQRAGLNTPAEEVTSIGAGGLSGPPLRERAVGFVRRGRELLGPDAVIIGVGGIEQASHVRAYLDAGADLVQLYTGFVYGGPGLPRQLAAELLRGGTTPLRKRSPVTSC
jgi:dihydroorotate dehydrogenase